MTTVRSQNGWIARPDTKLFTRGTAKLQGGTLLHFWAANDDVAVIFTDFIQQYDKRIERVAGPVLDDWSYANRLIRDSTSVVSNHGSATAIDINALQHPRKVHNTYSKAERAELRDLVGEYHGVLRHGEFYTGTIDGMHCEIDAGPNEVKHEADRIRARNAPKPAPPTKETDMATAPTAAEIAKQVWAAAQPLGGDPPQTPGGLLLTVSKRVAEGNLEAQVDDGIARALDDPAHPLSVILKRIEGKIDALAAPADPAEPQA
jgi:hypothetical protein